MDQFLIQLCLLSNVAWFSSIDCLDNVSEVHLHVPLQTASRDRRCTLTPRTDCSHLFIHRLRPPARDRRLCTPFVPIACVCVHRLQGFYAGLMLPGPGGSYR